MSEDVYKAGPCPQCGEFAVGTYRHYGAPVRCINGHEWHRDKHPIDGGDQMNEATMKSIKRVVGSGDADTCHKCNSVSGVYLQVCDDCMTRFNKMERAEEELLARVVELEAELARVESERDDARADLDLYDMGIAGYDY